MALQFKVKHGSLNSENADKLVLIMNDNSNYNEQNKWLQILLMIFMWSHKRYNRFIEIFGAIFMLILTFLYGYYTYYDNLELKIKLSICNVLDFGAFGAIRITSIYYFLMIFKKYPWDKLTASYHHPKLNVYYDKQIKSTNMRLIILILLYSFLITLHFVSYGLYFANRSWIATFFDFFASVYGVYIPIILTQCVLTFILLKYELFLYTIKKQIDLELDNGFVYINSIFSSYRSMYTSFKNEYGLIWQFFLSFDLFAICYAFWMIIASLIHKSNIFGSQEVSNIIWALSGTFYIIPFVEFVYSASKLNNQYVELKESLWNLRITIMKNPKKSIVDAQNIDILRHQSNVKKDENDEYKGFRIQMNFQSCFEYIKDHKLNVTLIGTRITAINALKGVIVFAVAKMISYSIYYI